MKRPLPMRQDPTLPDDLRSALRAESTAPPAHDVAAVKQALLTKVAAATAAGVGTVAAVGGAKSALGGLLAKLAGGATAAKIVVGATIAVVTAGVVSYTAVQLRSPAAQPPPPVEVVPRTPPQPVTPTPPVVPVAPPIAAPAETPIEFDPLSVRLPRGSGNLSAARPTAPASPTQPVPAVRPPSLADEVAQYETGRRALRAGKLAEAIAAFEHYLDQFKQGELRPEAGLSLVEAYIKAGKPDRAEAVARTLVADPTLRSRRGELLRVRAEAYVLMGRCSEAKIVYTQALGAGGTDLTRDMVEAALRNCLAGQGGPR